MGFIDDKYLSGGPDVLRYGSMTHQKLGGGKISVGKAFIYTKYPNAEGSRMTLVPPGEGHEKITEKPEVIEAMFGPKADEIKKIAANPYYSGPSVRTLAQNDGNIFGRSGWIKDTPVVMLWNLPAGSQKDILEITKEVGFEPQGTVLVHGVEELGLVRDFVASGGTEESKPESEELARLHLATGAEKEALQKRLGRTADVYAKHGQYPEPSEIPADKDEYPWLKKHYWDKAKELGDPYLGKYQEHMSFQDYVAKRENRGE